MSTGPTAAVFTTWSSSSAPCPACRPSCARSTCALALPALARGGQQLGERLLEVRGERVDVGHRVVVGEQPEVDLAVVAHDRHRERVVLGQERDRDDLLHLAPEQVERELRPRHVRDDQVEEARREVEPRGLGEQRRRREVVQAGDHLGAERLLRLLQLAHPLAARSAAARPGRPRTRAAARASRRSGCPASRCSSSERIETGTSARSSTPSVRTPRSCSQLPQRARHDRQHGVVHGAAERVLDLLEVRQPALHPAHAPVRADLHVERHVRRRVHARPRRPRRAPRPPRARARSSRPGAGARRARGPRG